MNKQSTSTMNSSQQSNTNKTESISVQNDDDHDITDQKIEHDYDSDSDHEYDDDPFKCRMYENDYPQKGDIVLVEIKKLGENAAYCNLLEYNNIEGLLYFTELSRTRIRSIRSIIKPGRREIVKVYKVDRNQQFIDLSKKRVDDEEIPEMKEKWSKSKAAHCMMRQVAVLSNKKYSMKQLYKLFGWKCAKDFGHLCEAFKFAMNNWDEFITKYSSIPKEIQPFLQQMIGNRLKAQTVTIRAEIEITCFTDEGVDAVKRALKAGFVAVNEINNNKKKNKDNMNLKIALVAPPLFAVSALTDEPKEGMKLIGNVINVMNENISGSNGTLRVKEEAQIIDQES